MTAADRARRARELHEALNSAFPADNHDSLDEPMRVAMLTLSQEETLRVKATEAARTRATKPVARTHPSKRASFWRRLVATLTGRRSA